ncbi:MAG: nucleotidyltransferase domain-containing protein [bacterium]|nr:nucleotidyltransferase domain-containing protein [bacterium]
MIFRFRKTIRELKSLDVALVYLFGSYILGTHNELSDIDLGVVLLKPYNGDYLSLFNFLYVIFSEVYPREEIDIVFLDKAPLNLRFEVVTTGKILYRVSKEFEYNYKERVMKEYIDMKPLLEEQNKTLLERI